jgi:hypothetical protein
MNKIMGTDNSFENYLYCSPHIVKMNKPRRGTCTMLRGVFNLKPRRGQLGDIAVVERKHSNGT